MAYKALYRTYRPKTFADVAGQKHIVRTLQHALDQNKVAHAYLFCGPRGTGKTTIAKIFARMVNCENKNEKPCVDCDNCRAVMAGNHPDIIEIDAASNNGVDEVRNLIEKVKYAPLLGKYKVYIIDEVHMMSTGAFNALLKTIEEPPEHIIFILATTEPHKVLPTIISRCQRFDFTRIADNDIADRLKTVVKEEQIQCEDDVIHLIAQLSEGGLRDALSILDQCIAYAQDDLKVQHLNEIYGITTTNDKLRLFEYISSSDTVQLLNKIQVFEEKGIDIKMLTYDLIELLKESVIYDLTKEEKLLSKLRLEEAIQMQSYFEQSKKLKFIDLLMETYDKYRFAASIHSYFQVCMLKLVDMNMTVTTSSELNLTKDVSRETLIDNIDVTANHNINNLANADKTNNTPMHLNDEEVINNEEIKKQNTKPDFESIEDEFILSLLSGANKPEKVKDTEGFQAIKQFCIDLKWGKFANLLKSACIVGSGTNYIVISVENQAEANHINELDKNNEFCSFMVEIVHKPKKVFAISIEQQRRIIDVFKERMIDGTLPGPVIIEDVVVDKQISKEKDQEDVILDLFGKDNIIIMEE